MGHIEYGSGVNNTSGTTGPWPGTNFVYTDYGTGIADGNLNDGGARPIHIGALNNYVYSGGGVRSLMVYQGLLFAGTYTFGSSGGGFQSRIEYTSGTLNFGRNYNNGAWTNDSRGGGWQGGLCGGYNYAFVPWACQNVSLSKSGRSVTVTFAGPASDGDSGITNYVAQLWADDGAGWRSQQNSGGTTTWSGLTPGRNYKARVLAQNGVGNSPWVESNTVYIPPAGKRMTGPGASTGLTIGRRCTSPGTFAEQTIGKRHNGTGWVDFA